MRVPRPPAWNGVKSGALDATNGVRNDALDATNGVRYGEQAVRVPAGLLPVLQNNPVSEINADC